MAPRHHRETIDRTPALAAVTCLALGAISLGCAPRSEIHWVNDTTFVVPRANIAEQVQESYGRSPTWHLRATAALDHNCPLDRVAVVAERRDAGAPAYFVVRACDIDHMYMEHGGAYVVVTRRAPVAQANEKKGPNR